MSYEYLMSKPYFVGCHKNINKSFRSKGKQTENYIKYFTIAHMKTTNLGKFDLLPEVLKTENQPSSRKQVLLN